MSNEQSSPFFDVRMRGFRDRAEVDAVLALLDSRTVPLAGETVSLRESAGRVLAEALVSEVDVPGFPRAAMDGFAVRAEDTFGADAYNPLPLVLIGESLPAKPFTGEVQPGQAVRIMTGAPIPTGADAVLMAEVAQVEANGRVLAREPVSPGRHVGRVGEDVAKGSSVLPAGRLLRPQDVGLLASIGSSTVQVIRQPRVAILVTGNELLPPGAKPEGFKIVDSNSPMLEALAARDGAEVLPVRYLRDDYNSVRDAIRDTDADVILVSGGSSVGAEDHAPRAVAELGEL
ncbi:MAG: molybdopterin molybdotransferase MoeA, partial [Planctomycetia bacterium]|nr:molybdopterin molybdotransferase MoeA [Planctomycetia bacterium]